MPIGGIDAAEATVTLTSPIVGAAEALSVAAEAPTVNLTASHAGRLMRTREGEPVGPLEYDAGSFGYNTHKHWRGSLGWGRAYYSSDGRVVDGEDGPNDIVGEWDRRGDGNVASER